MKKIVGLILVSLFVLGITGHVAFAGFPWSDERAIIDLANSLANQDHEGLGLSGLGVDLGADDLTLGDDDDETNVVFGRLPDLRIAK